jgi:hypothetical protein
VKPSKKTPIFFWTLSAIVYFSLYFILYPNLPVWYYAVSSTSVGLKVYLSYIVCAKKDPGILKQDENDKIDFVDLLKKFSPADLCPDCKVIRTAKSRHCAICNVCVERYDHHCTWLNNCVGIRNHGMYLSYLCFLWVLCLLVMCIAMDCLGRGPMKDTHNSPFGPLCFAGICNVPAVQRIFGFFDLIVSTVFFVPSTLLLYIHSKNFIYGQTTHERFSKKGKSKDEIQDELEETHLLSQSSRDSIKLDDIEGKNQMDE